VIDCAVPFVSDTSVCDTGQFPGDMVGNVFARDSIYYML